MDEIILKYYKTINQLQSNIANADSFQNALSKGLDVVIKQCHADYAVVWYEDVKGDSVLHPYYWMCPIDFSSKSHKLNEGVVGRVYANQTSEKYLDYQNSDKDKYTDNDFDGLDIGSMVCVPLSNKYDKLGCIQFINSKDSNKFTQEDADLCEILTSLIAINIDENVHINRSEDNKNLLIKVRNIKKQYKSGEIITKVLKGINLDVYEGEFLVLLGESGCGKSTLLNIIGGMDSADGGEFFFDGKDMINANKEELTKYRRDNIGFIFQSYNLMPNLNAKQNLDLIGELVSSPLKSKEILESVGLEGKDNSYPSELSGGQQQRVSIARSLIKKPRIIMADEPTAALDYQTSVSVLEELAKVTKGGTTLIMVTHNEEIAKMADRVIKIRDGKLYETTVNRHPLSAKELVW